MVAYTIKARKEARNIKGIEYLYDEKYAVCNECQEEITVPGLDDENEREIDNVFRKNNDLITIDEIIAIMDKYNIEKRPLSNLLGLGELTITRYLDGQLPTKRYSDMLLRLLHYDEEMKCLLAENKDRITANAYRKVETAILNREQLLSHETKIEAAALYVVSSLYEVTNLSLQKLLYYFKAFGYVFYGKDWLGEECEDLLTREERMAMDYALQCFAIYNGGVLREITHRERPWQNAREGLGDTQRCTNIIKNDDIQQYFKEMDARYNLQKRQGGENYIKSLNVI